MLPLALIPILEIIGGAVVAVAATKALPERVSVDIEFRK